ncbi:hypothetical protein L7F22_034711 [Adiantum nelumboides]|nr:hypothetical protein [Adiantum nelumboides]
MVEKEKDLKVKSIRSDRGGEFLSENFARWCKSEGIRRQLTTPYTPSQNGVVERKNRTIMEMARAMLAHASLPRSYWAEACNTAVYIQNRSPTHALQDMIPFQAYYGRKPTVSQFRVFGCSAFVHIPKEKRQKLDFKFRKLLFLGYSAESDAYRLYDPDTRTTTAGVTWGFLAGSHDSLKEGYRGFSRAVYVINSVGRNSALWGCCAGTYFGFNCGLERLRRRRDWANATVAGAVTGALLAAKSGSASKVLATSAALSAVATTMDILFPLPYPPTGI